jgi:hypothetical protein
MGDMPMGAAGAFDYPAFVEAVVQISVKARRMP